MDDRLTRRFVEVNWHNLALGHDVFQADGATFVRNTALPIIYDANFVFGISASEPSEIERLLARASREYPHTTRVTFRVDPFTPPAFEARLACDGYDRSDAIVLVLDGSLRKQARTLEIMPVESESTWRAYAELKRVDWREYAVRIGVDPDNVAVANGLVLSNRLKCPPAQYVLAYQDERPVAYCSAWEGLKGVGQVEDLFVHPAYRHRGIATALLHNCVAMLRASGVGPVVIVSDVTDTPKDMYTALGWSPVALCRQYGKKVEGSLHSN